jgi:hypothetical protein
MLEIKRDAGKREPTENDIRIHDALISAYFDRAKANALASRDPTGGCFSFGGDGLS